VAVMEKVREQRDEFAVHVRTDPCLASHLFFSSLFFSLFVPMRGRSRSLDLALLGGDDGDDASLTRGGGVQFLADLAAQKQYRRNAICSNRCTEDDEEGEEGEGEGEE